MNFDFAKQDYEFMEEVEDFVKKEMPSDWEYKAIYWPAGYGTMPTMEKEYKEFCDNFIKRLGQKGWLSLGWPKEYGGQKSMLKHAILQDVLSYYRLPYGDVSNMLAAPVIIQAGSEKMKKEWLPKIAKGEVRFWLGYSEPNAGSDVASIQTRAEKEGGNFIVNGQKVWSSGAHIADYAWLVARTGAVEDRQRGLSLMIVDNSSPGITIRPLENICGIHSFNEVFFDQVRVPEENLVGEVNKGFYYLMLALLHERFMIGIGSFKRVFEELTSYVRENKDIKIGCLERKKLAELYIDIEALYGIYWRAAWLVDRGIAAEKEVPALKLFATELSIKMANISIEVMGQYGQLLKGNLAPLQGRIALGYLDSISGAIGAGTSEIQRGIIATRGLGLPRG